jgi:hypothetical protein
MLLVDRYVEAVSRHLPRNQRDDIAAELRDTLRSQVEAAESDAGRPLSDEDVAGILRRYGAPEVVAARYGEPRYVIGPGIYPYYKAAVKVLLWGLGSLLTVALIVTAFTGSDPVAAMTRIVWTGVLVVMFNLTIVTLIFAHLERMRDHVTWARRWDPRDLLHESGKRLSIPRAETGAAFVLTVFWLLWWTDALPINQWLLWSRLPLVPAPIWDALTPLIVSVMVAHILVSGVAMVRPRWVRFHDAAIILLDLGIGVVLYRALRAPAMIVVTDDRAQGAALAGLFNTLLTVGLLAFALLVAVSIGSTVRQWTVLEKRGREVDSGAASPSRP